MYAPVLQWRIRPDFLGKENSTFKFENLKLIFGHYGSGIFSLSPKRHVKDKCKCAGSYTSQLPLMNTGCSKKSTPTFPQLPGILWTKQLKKIVKEMIDKLIHNEKNY